MINLARENEILKSDNADLRIANAELQSIVRFLQKEKSLAQEQADRIIEMLDPEYSFYNVLSGFDDRSIAGIVGDIALIAKYIIDDKERLEENNEYLVEQIEKLIKRHDL